MRQKIISQYFALLTSLLFFIALSTPFVISIFSKKSLVSVAEKRKLHTFPSLPITLSKMKSYTHKLDDYYSDQFGLRLLLANYYKHFIYSLSDSPSEDVTIGKEGWLFLGSIKDKYNKNFDPIGHARNRYKYTPEELDHLVNRIQSVNDYLEQRGIKYILILAPNKHSIYPEMLPDGLLKKNNESATDQLMAAIKKRSSVTVLDLRAELINGKKDQELYSKFGTHWNNYGANIAQLEITKTINSLLSLNSLPKKYPLKTGQSCMADLSLIMGLECRVENDLPYPVFNNSCDLVRTPKKVTSNRETHSQVCNSEKNTAVIFRDSFFSALEPYIARHFNKSVFIWRYMMFNDLKVAIDRNHPDIVIEEMVERRFLYMNDFNLPSSIE